MFSGCSGLLLPALTIALLLVVGVLRGALPVSVAAEGERRIKVEVKQISATGYGAFPQFFETRDGSRHTVVVIGLSEVSARGLCGSGKVETPFGDYVLRVDAAGGEPLEARELKLAIENIDGATLGGESLTLNRHDTAADGTPRDSGHVGTLPITARSLLLDLHADVRWFTASGLRFSGADLTAGTDVRECF